MAKKENKSRITENITQNAIELARYGLSYEEMDKVLDAEPGSIEKHAKRSANFCRLLETAELNAVIEAERALFKRAVGYEVTEEYRTYIPAHSDDTSPEPETKLKEIKFVKKIVPPDASALLIYLYNRRGKRWSKNPDSQSGITVEEYLDMKDEVQKQAEENI